MSFLSILDALSPGNWGTMSFIKREYPEPVERHDMVTKQQSMVTVYEAVREIQCSLGQSLAEGWAVYAGELKRGQVQCTRDGRIIFQVQADARRSGTQPRQ
jgi:hypothetical protein